MKLVQILERLTTDNLIWDLSGVVLSLGTAKIMPRKEVISIYLQIFLLFSIAGTNYNISTLEPSDCCGRWKCYFGVDV